MRGPGAVPGLYATESAMNELADQLKIDPVKLRILNEPKIDESLGIPFSSRHLLECLSSARRSSAGRSARPRSAR
jgi:xanthine dehydrogenase YagR molybdenum-binding subunit